MEKLLAFALACLGSAALGGPVPVAPAAPQGSDVFSELTIAEARDLAHREGRLLLFAFYAEDCAPCRDWDRTTFSDGDVRGWIAAKTVALRVVDAPELAARYAIGPRPTILVLDSQGAEIERLDTLLPPRDFLAAMTAAVAAGSGQADRQRRSAEARSSVDRGRALARQGQGALALEQFLQAFDTSRDLPAWAEVRLRGLLGEISQLFPEVPAARTALAGRRDAAAGSLLEEREAPRPNTELVIDARELVALDRTLGSLETTRAAWLALSRRAGSPPAVLEALFGDELQAFLLDEKHYAEFLTGLGDPLVVVEGRLARLQAHPPEAEADANLRASRSFERNAALNLTGRCYEALLGLGRDAEAGEVEELLLGLEPRAQAYATLAVAARRVERDERVSALVERGLATLPEDERRSLKALSAAWRPEQP